MSKSKENNETDVYFNANCNELVFDEDEEDPEDNEMCYFCVKCDREFQSVSELYSHKESRAHIDSITKVGDTKLIDAQNKWIRENFCKHYGFGHPCKECNIEDISYENRLCSQASDEPTDEVKQLWNDGDQNDWDCSSDDSGMRRIRRQIHHPLEHIGTDCGVASDEEDLQHFDVQTEKPFGDCCKSKGRRVDIIQLDPVAKEKQVPRDEDERVTRLPGGWCVFEKKTDQGIQERIVLVNAYKATEQGGCCPEPRMK